MLELADIVRRHGPKYRERFGERMPEIHRRALDAIERCRTADNGGHLYGCTHCGHAHFGYHSCNHRSCPKCGGAAAQLWLKGQCERLLPVPYFLITFTLPEQLRALCRSFQKLFYEILFDESVATLKEIADIPRHLGGELGFLGVLHTWTRQLAYHPHVHYIVPGGGLRPDGRTWRKCRITKQGEPYLLPFELLSCRFRNRFKERLQAEAPELFKSIAPYVWLIDWVVHSQSVGAGREALNYLSAYVFRTALSNKRLISDHNGDITFGYIESQTGKSQRLVLDAITFLARLLQHVLPAGFHKVRYYGWLHPRARKRFLLVQTLLALPLILSKHSRGEPAPPPHLRCPICGNFTLEIIARLKRAPP